MNVKPEYENAFDDDIELTPGGVPHPAGTYRAVFVGAKKVVRDPNDPDDRRFIEQYGNKAQIRLMFQTEAERENGDPFGLSVFTAPSLHPKGKVRPLLMALGVDVDRLDLRQFRLSDYADRKLVLVIEQEPTKDGEGKKAVVKSFQPLPARRRPRFDEDEDELPAAA